MTTALKKIEPETTEIWTVQDLEVMADRVAKSRLFGLDASQAFTLMLLCQSEGIHPAKAMQRYHVIQGRPAMRADAMLADFLRIGGIVKWITESDDREKCEAVFTHPRFAPEGKTIRFSVSDAKLAGLTEKRNSDGSPNMWSKYPAAMLRARVVSIGVRMLTPGIVAGLYTPEEVSDFTTEVEVQVVPPEPPEHHAVNHDNKTGHGSGAYAPPDRVAAYSEWIRQVCEDVNTKWLDHLTDKSTGEISGKAPAELITTWQLSGHLLKFAKQQAWVDIPEEIRAGQRDKFAAIAYDRHREAIEEEAMIYCRQLWSRASKAYKAIKRDPGSDDEISEDEALDKVAEEGVVG